MSVHDASVQGAASARLLVSLHGRASLSPLVPIKEQDRTRADIHRSVFSFAAIIGETNTASLIYVLCTTSPAVRADLFEKTPLRVSPFRDTARGCMVGEGGLDHGFHSYTLS